MSIYATCVQFTDAWEPNPEEGELGAPYIYKASHVRPTADGERGGDFDVSIIPPHIGGEYADFLRVGLYGSERNPGTVLLHRRHVEELHAFLGKWLRRELPVMREAE